ncbi:fibronectin type III-like domain-contianing protein [Streptomyces sp. NPDC096048]|uniref:fibronectin type III-like domain-contianing protein n=1 Tax=Streptomyces sp. NPDC096048 TaxID=3366072 RepID=UPI0037F178BA
MAAPRSARHPLADRTATGRFLRIRVLYVPPTGPGPDRPARWLAGLAHVTAAPGESASVTVEPPDRAFEIWDGDGRRRVAGTYDVHVARSLADIRLTEPLALRPADHHQLRGGTWPAAPECCSPGPMASLSWG